MTLRTLLESNLANPSIGWSIGIFGALAEFHREAGEDARCEDLAVSTARGAIRLAVLDECRPVPYEPRSEKQADRKFGVALCLPEGHARLESRAVLTELGPDAEAIRPEDRKAVLFDLGLDTPYGTFCVRTADDHHVQRLRAAAGQPLLEVQNGIFEEIACMSPHRVFMSRMGRIEVYQPIAPKGGATPTGPHTHLLPKLASRRRTHSANAILPAGLVPCATFYPEKGGHA
jgi:hypothetical protein